MGVQRLIQQEGSWKITAWFSGFSLRTELTPNLSRPLDQLYISPPPLPGDTATGCRISSSSRQQILGVDPWTERKFTTSSHNWVQSDSFYHPEPRPLLSITISDSGEMN